MIPSTWKRKGRAERREIRVCRAVGAEPGVRREAGGTQPGRNSGAGKGLRARGGTGRCWGCEWDTGLQEARGRRCDFGVQGSGRRGFGGVWAWGGI